MNKTEADIKAASAKREINKKNRKAAVKLQKQVDKTFKNSLKTKKVPERVETKQQKRMGVLMLRDSKYPMEFAMHNHNVYLNPLKKMIKGGRYMKDEYQDVMNGIIRDFMMKQQAAAKQAEQAKAAPVQAQVESNIVDVKPQEVV